MKIKLRNVSAKIHVIKFGITKILVKIKLTIHPRGTIKASGHTNSLDKIQQMNKAASQTYTHISSLQVATKYADHNKVCVSLYGVIDRSDL